ncbi:TauD/TfdA family dioxygenase [Pseudomonas sp. NPDC078700]|uniref:TauD/TfdA family dioxygenase n=1 Tax=Pseudomonas sp. NPDC078700 TaxID=3364424 RepID=UPI0037CC1FD4
MSTISFSFDEAAATLTFNSRQGNFAIPVLWLRERSQDPQQLDALTQQRLFNSHGIDPHINLAHLEAVDNEKAWLEFTDGHRALYDFTGLVGEIVGHSIFPQPQAWNSTLQRSRVRADWRAMNDPQAFLDALTIYLTYGFVVLHHVPTEPESILEVGRKFGYVKETNFGRYFEVYSRPDGNDLAYRSVHLGPHTDNPYRDPVPGIQLLHCLVNETTGGLSTLVDSVNVVSILAAEDPQGYELLCNTPVSFRFVDQGTELITKRSIINRDAQGHTLGVHYSPRLDGLPLLPVEQLRAFHRARQRLGELFVQASNEIQFRLEPGELILFDNSRILHGRTRYDSSEGHRHLQGCYIDLDGPEERFASTLKQLSRT